MFYLVHRIVAEVDQGSLEIASDGEVVGISLGFLGVVLREQLVLCCDRLLQPGDPRS